MLFNKVAVVECYMVSVIFVVVEGPSSPKPQIKLSGPAVLSETLLSNRSRHCGVI